ncbi:RING finger protein 32 isoform X1 [Synchiropus splendidus]|uniref:RING finger protein 32 isoform X1 n=2 Tax=Synchiropus splendidus TaxID=270530 RepID=UPI00237DAB03|nr:RING finger protein 32 isoform X1 [Synchiropus splendidus]
MATRKGLPSKNSTRNLVFTSVAFQDHINRTLFLPDLLLSDPLHRNKLKAPRTLRLRNEVMVKEHVELDPVGDREYVLDVTPPPLTLAQRVGLVPAPPERLSEDEWSQVKSRSVQERESEHPCAICKEAFHLQPQVLLSCSHVFHRACLQSFERFSRRKCCPMCRTEQYETRVIHDGARLYKHLCATRIQACWRGHAARKRFHEIRKTVCPKDKQLRRKFLEEKLQELNDCFVLNLHTDTDAFLSEIDQSLSSSRRIFQQLERKLSPELNEEDWARLQSQVMSRGVWECPICLTALCSLPETEADGSSHSQRRTALLSCSHLFHQHCLEALETFAGARRPSCPLCRSVYHRRLI